MRREGGEEGACFGRILNSLLVSLWLCGSCNGLDFFFDLKSVAESGSLSSETFRSPFFYEFLVINSVAVD